MRVERSHVNVGYWESKGPDVDLKAAIAEKLEQGYPDSNILFENSKYAILIQDGKEFPEVNFDDTEALRNCLERFVAFQSKVEQDFVRAIDKFKEDLPALLAELRAKIDAIPESS